MPETLRAALRKPIWRSSICAVEPSASVTTAQSGQSASGATVAEIPCLAIRGLSNAMSWSATIAAPSSAWTSMAKIGWSAGSRSPSRIAASEAADCAKNCSAAWLALRNRPCRSSTTTAIASEERIDAASGSSGCARRSRTGASARPRRGERPAAARGPHAAARSVPASISGR